MNDEAVNDGSVNDPAVSARSAASHRGNAWDRYGALFASIWLVFLGFPISAVARSDHSTPVKVTAYVLIACFAVIYASGFRGTIAIVDANHRWPRLALLIAIIATLTPVIGWDALGMTTYLCAYSMIVMSLRAGIMVTTICVAAAAVATIQQPALIAILFPIVGTGVSTGLWRYLSERTYRAEQQRWHDQLAEDRDRVARDVHDVLGHSLTAVVLKAQLAERLIDTDPDRAREELREIERLSRTAIGEIRTTVGQLRATRFADELEGSRASLADAGIDVSIDHDPDLIDPRARVTAAWTVREATTNIIRHSGATQVSITWGSDWIEVIDNGRGIGGAKEGHGLTGLRERIAAVGGTLEVEPVTGATGTRLKATHP